MTKCDKERERAEKSGLKERERVSLSPAELVSNRAPEVIPGGLFGQAGSRQAVDDPGGRSYLTITYGK